MIVVQLEIRPIPGYEGYFADSDGGIWSDWQRGRPRVRESKKHKMKPRRAGKGGYLQVRTNKGMALVSRLVCAAFYGPCPDSFQCCHRNSYRLDNRAINLRWGSSSENHRDTLLEKLNGPNFPSVEDILEIRRRRENRERLKDVAKDYGVSCAQISRIANKQQWGFVS